MKFYPKSGEIILFIGNLAAMGRAQHLTFEEKVKIKTYHDAGLSSRAIGRKIFRSHTVVGRFLKKAKNGGHTDKRGKKSKLSEEFIEKQ